MYKLNKHIKKIYKWGGVFILAMFCSNVINAQTVALDFPQSTCTGCTGTVGSLDYSTVSTTGNINLDVTLSVAASGHPVQVSGIVTFAGGTDYYLPIDWLGTITGNGASQTFTITLDKNFYPDGIYTFQLTNLTYFDATTSTAITSGVSGTSSQRVLYKVGVNFKPKQTQLIGSGSAAEFGKYDGQIILGQCSNYNKLTGNVYLPTFFTYDLTCEISEIANDYSQVGLKVSKAMTSTDITNLNNGTFDYFAFALNTGGTPNVTITDGKKYGISFILHNVSNGLSHWSQTSWFITYKNKDYDLVVRDFTFGPQVLGSGYIVPHDGDDQGQENNRSNGSIYEINSNIYRSPDLWNRYSNSSATGGRTGAGDFLSLYNQTPDFVTNPNNANYLYVAVKNIGCATSPDPGENLRAFWTRARLGEVYDKDWKYDVTSYNFANYFDGMSNIQVPLGSEITISSPTILNPHNASSLPTTIASVPTYTSSSTSWVYAKNGSSNGLKWYPPNPDWYDASNGSMSGIGTPIVCLLTVIGDNVNNVDPLTVNPLSTTVNIEDFVRQNNNVATRNGTLIDLTTFRVDPMTGIRNTNFHTTIANNPSGGASRICLRDMYPYTGIDNFNNYATLQVGFTDLIWSNWVTNGMSGTGFSVVSPTLVEITNYTEACFDNITIGNNMNEQMGVRVVYDSTTVMPSTPINYLYSLQQFGYDDNAAYTGSAINFLIPISDELNNSSESKTTGFNTLPLEGTFMNVYPNPAQNSLSILSSTKAEKIIVRNTLGVEVLTHIVKDANTNNLVSIDISSLPKGAYVVTQQSVDGSLFTSKFIKN